jgi:DtxR family Mn-dependent transcriptional regulator
MTGVHAGGTVVQHCHRKDEILEALWTMREDGLKSIADLRARVETARLDELVEDLVSGGMIFRDGDNIGLTAAGEQRGGEIIRRHRLAERLFSDVFGLNEPQWEASACSFEHILDEAVVDAVCTFLGHPPVCPHDKPIPPGKCCRDARRPVEPLVIPLVNLKVGGNAKIIFITPRTKTRLSRLSSLGVIPGSLIHLQQRYPSYVIRVDQSEVALEGDIAREIFVRPEPG